MGNKNNKNRVNDSEITEDPISSLFNLRIFEIDPKDIKIIDPSYNDSENISLGKWYGQNVVVKTFNREFFYPVGLDERTREVESKTVNPPIPHNNLKQRLALWEKLIEMYSSVSHPYLERFYGCALSEKDQKIMVLSEYFKGKTLNQFINFRIPLKFEAKLKVLEMISSVLTYLHSRMMLYYMFCGKILSDERIIVQYDEKSTSLEVRLLAGFSTNEMTLDAKSLEFRECGEDFDLFCLGIIIYEVVTGDLKRFRELKKDVNFEEIVYLAKKDNDISFRTRVKKAFDYPLLKEELKELEEIVKGCFSSKKLSIFKIRGMLEKMVSKRSDLSSESKAIDEPDPIQGDEDTELVERFSYLNERNECKFIISCSGREEKEAMNLLVPKLSLIMKI